MLFRKVTAITAASLVSILIVSCSSSDSEGRNQDPTKNPTSNDLPTTYNTEVVGTWEDICDVADISEFAEHFSSDDISGSDEAHVDVDDDNGYCSIRIPDAFTVTVWLNGTDDSQTARDRYEYDSRQHEDRAADRHEDAFSENIETSWDESTMVVQPDTLSEEGMWFVARFDSLSSFVSVSFSSNNERCDIGELNGYECVPNAPDLANWIEDNYVDLLLENIIEKLEEE